MRFERDQTYLPVTVEQFQDLTNELLKEFNALTAPNFVTADFFSQVLMAAIHALDHKIGFYSKSSLFDACVNRVSCNMTYQVVQEIQARLKAEQGMKPTLVPEVPDEPALC